MPKLHLSQDLRINDKFTISVPGETESYFSGCSESGEAEWIPRAEVWYALTDKAKEVWQGETRQEDGVTYGRLFMREEV